MPLVCVSRWRSVIFSQVGGVPGRNLLTVIVQPEFAVLGKQEDAHRRELLGDGRHLVHAFRQGRELEFDVGKPVALGEDEFVVYRYRQRQAGDALLVHLLLDQGVDGRLRGIGGRFVLRVQDG